MERDIERRETESELVYIVHDAAPGARRWRGSLDAEAIVSALRKGLTVRISNASVSGDLRLDSESIQSRIQMERCDFLGTVDLRYCHFAKPVWLSNCRFARSLDLTGAIFDYELRLSGSTFAGPVELSGSTIAHLMCRGARFADQASFISISINGVLQMSGTHFRKGVTFNGGRVAGSVWLDGCISGGDIDFVTSEIGGTVLLNGAKLKQGTLFYGAKIGGHMLLRAAVFGAKVDCGRISVSGTLLSEEAVFEGAASFNGMRVNDTAAFDRAVFRRDADFVSAHFGGPTSFTDAVFDGGLVLDGCSVGADLDMNGIKVAEKLHLAVAHVTRNVFLSRAALDATTLFIYAEIGGSAVFSDSDFLREAQFDHTKIGGPANFDRARFAKEATFDYLNVGENARLRGTAFNASLSMQHVAIGGALDFGTSSEGREGPNQTDKDDSTRHTAFAGSASFVGATVQGDADFRDVQFASDVSFDGTTIRGSAFFKGATFDAPARFVAAKVSGDLSLDGCEFRGTAKVDRLVAEGFITCKVTQFRQGVSFWEVRARAGLGLIGTFFFDKVTFDNAEFGSIALAPAEKEDAIIVEDGRSVEVKAWFMGDVDLRGLTYNELIPWSKWTELFERMSPHDRQPFTHLEELFRRRGQTEEADRVYFMRKTREFQLFKKRRPLAFLADRFLWFLTGYGVRLRRLVIALAICVAVGTVVFHQQGSVRVRSQQELALEPGWLGNRGSLSLLDAFWFSFATVLPVELGIETRLEASSSYLWKLGTSGVGIRYTTVRDLLRLAGWILIPIGLAGVTGWLKR